MKKLIFIAYLMIFSLGISAATGSTDIKKTSDNTPTPAKKENKLSDEEVNRLTKRVEEIRAMDMSKMTAKEKRETRKELKTIKEDLKKQGYYIYIGAGTLLIIILILILI